MLLLGGGAAYVADHSGASSATTSAAATAPGAQGGAAGAPNGAGASGMQPTDFRLEGTITAVGNGTVSVATTSGTQTYTVSSTTQLSHDGATAALSAFQVGETVRASTTTQGGTVLNDLMSGQGAAGAAPNAGGTAPGAAA